MAGRGKVREKAMLATEGSPRFSNVLLTLQVRCPKHVNWQQGLFAKLPFESRQALGVAMLGKTDSWKINR